MPNKIPSAKLLWIQFEDVVAPGLGLTVKDRVVYSYLLRHSLVVGKTRLKFSVMGLSRTLGLSMGVTRQSVRRLDELGVLRVLERSNMGHLAEMRLPEQIRAIRPSKNGSSGPAQAFGEAPDATLEATDFLKTAAFRKSIHDRDGADCSYCLRHTPANHRCIDHVVPRARHGRNSYRNLVTCCMDCNTLKGDTPAPDYLRLLYRKGRLTPAELDAGLRKLRDLAAGKLRPVPPPA